MLEKLQSGNISPQTLAGSIAQIENSLRYLDIQTSRDARDFRTRIRGELETFKPALNILIEQETRAIQAREGLQ